MTAAVRVLSTASVDSSPSVLIIDPSGSKILINCGEGCQRCFLEHSQRLTTVNAICLTHLSHDAIGGLPGAILTASDAMQASIEAAEATASGKLPGSTRPTKSVPGLDVVGPIRTKAFVHSLRHFMKRESFDVRVHEGSISNFLPLVARNKNAQANDNVRFSIHTIVCHATEISSRKRPLEDTSYHHGQQQLLSFIFTTPSLPGKFLPQKAIELGVPKGPMFAQLKSGKAVTFLDKQGIQKTVQSEEVVLPSSPGVALMVLYYPNKSIASQIVSSSEFLAVMGSKDIEVDLVIHMTTESVHHACKSLWQNSGLMESSVVHMFLNIDQYAEHAEGTPFRSAELGAIARSMICQDIYGKPLRPSESKPIQTDEVLCAQALMEYVLIPRAKKGFIGNNSVSFSQELDNLLLSVSGSGAMEIGRTLVASIPNTTNGDTGELLLTGTGSAIPCKHRNVTGMLLQQRNGSSMLLDVGEGTVGQILRNSKRPTVDQLNSIRAAWISHPHADHHLGILRLLSERTAPDPLILIAPIPLFRFLDEYKYIEPKIQHAYTKIDCNDLLNEDAQANELLFKTLGITKCQAVPVHHCAHAFAVILDGTSFGRLVYSGDCRPSRQLAELAKGADVLIHEATFEDGMEAEANLKRHCTIGEAMNIAYLMQAKVAVLTHFSQRYPRIPPVPASESHNIPVIFGFDHMRLTPTTLKKAALLTPALRLLYPDDDKTNQSCASDSKEKSENAMNVPGLFAQSDLL